LAQCPEGVAQILAQSIKKRDRADFAMRFVQLVDAAQLDPGQTFRLVARQAPDDMILSQELDVRLEFELEVAVEIGALEHGAYAGNYPVQCAEHRLFFPFPLQKTRDGAGYPLPVLGFRDELFLAGLGDGVEPGLAIVLRYAPLRLDPFLLHQANQAEINGALVYLQRLFAHLLDAAGNAVAMQGSHGFKGPEDHQIERALKNLRLVLRHVRHLLWAI
jgi:hypothetical protein